MELTQYKFIQYFLFKSGPQDFCKTLSTLDLFLLTLKILPLNNINIISHLLLPTSSTMVTEYIYEITPNMIPDKQL